MSKFIKATISSTTVGTVYERTLTAEIDGANEFVWLTDVHVNTVKDINEVHSMAINFDDLRRLQRVIDNELN